MRGGGGEQTRPGQTHPSSLLAQRPALPPAEGEDEDEDEEDEGRGYWPAAGEAKAALRAARAAPAPAGPRPPPPPPPPGLGCEALGACCCGCCCGCGCCRCCWCCCCGVGILGTENRCGVCVSEDLTTTSCLRLQPLPPRSRPGLDSPTSQMGACSSHSRQKLSSSSDSSTLSMPVLRCTASPLAARKRRRLPSGSGPLGVLMRRRYSILRGTDRRRGSRPGRKRSGKGEE